MINRAKQESSGSGSPDADATTPGAVGNGSGALPGRRDTYLAETPTKRPSRPPRRRAGPAHRDEDEGDGGVLTRMRTRRREADETVRAAERELETAREAARIEAQSLARRPGGEVDAEMRELVERWRGACRTAAEELLGLIGDRVAGMGGARAWRESRKRQAEPFRDFDGGGVAAGAETGSRMDGDDGDGDGDGDGGRTEGEEQGEETGDETVGY